MEVPDPPLTSFGVSSLSLILLPFPHLVSKVSPGKGQPQLLLAFMFL